MESYFTGLTELAEQKEPEKKELDYATIQEKFWWRVIKRLNDILEKK